jgi:hypothetical protein
MSVSTAQQQMPPGLVPPGGPMSGPMPRVNVRRRRSPAMVSLGVVLVIIGALAGWRYVASTSTGTRAYIAVYQAVPVGGQITADDLQAVSISSARGLTPIPVSDSHRVIGQFAKVALVPGTLLTDGDLVASNAIGAGQAMVGLQLTPNQRPGRTLHPGDQVMLVLVPPTNGGSGNADTVTMPNLAAKVVEALAPDTNNDVVVDVIIPVNDASFIAAYAKLGRISAVLVSGS